MRNIGTLSDASNRWRTLQRKVRTANTQLFLDKCDYISFQQNDWPLVYIMLLNCPQDHLTLRFQSDPPIFLAALDNRQLGAIVCHGRTAHSCKSGWLCQAAVQPVWSARIFRPTGRIQLSFCSVWYSWCLWPFRWRWIPLNTIRYSRCFKPEWKWSFHPIWWLRRSR